MFGTRMKFVIVREPFDFNVCLKIGMMYDDKVVSVAEPLVFKDRAEGSYANNCLSFSEEDAQQLMDELWRAGFRPMEGTGSAGSLAATEKHLDDMRKIVFSKLGIK